MVANPPRSRIPLCFLPRTPGQPGGMGLCQILLEDVVAIRIHLLDPEDYILPQKVHINVRANLFADANEQSDISGCCCPLCTAPYCMFQISLGEGKIRMVGSMSATERSIK